MAFVDFYDYGEDEAYEISFAAYKLQYTEACPPLAPTPAAQSVQGSAPACAPESPTAELMKRRLHLHLSHHLQLLGRALQGPLSPAVQDRPSPRALPTVTRPASLCRLLAPRR